MEKETDREQSQISEYLEKEIEKLQVTGKCGFVTALMTGCKRNRLIEIKKKYDEIFIKQKGNE